MTISFLLQNNVEGKTLDCVHDSFWSRPPFEICKILYADLSENPLNETLEIDGLDNAAPPFPVITAVWLHYGKVDYIPLEFLEQFPILNGLIFYGTKSSIMDNHFFSSKFNRIEYLSARHVKTRKIDENAFEYLVNLKWIRLSSNKLQSINAEWFKHNPDLEYIDLSDNL